MHAVRVPQLEADKKGYCFDAKEAAVNVITCERTRLSVNVCAGGCRVLRRGGRLHTKKQVVCIRTRPSNFEYLYHVEKLAVNITDDRHRCENVHHVALLHEELFRLRAYCLDDRLGQEFLLVKPCYALIEVDSCYGGREKLAWKVFLVPERYCLHGRPGISRGLR